MTYFLSAVKLQNSPFIIRHFSFIFPKCFLLFSLGMFFSANCHHLSFHRVMQNKIKKWRQKTSVFLIAKAILESKTPLRLLQLLYFPTSSHSAKLCLFSHFSLLLFVKVLKMPNEAWELFFLTFRVAAKTKQKTVLSNLS